MPTCPTARSSAATKTVRIACAVTGALVLTSCGAEADPEHFEVTAGDAMARGAWSDFATFVCANDRKAFLAYVADGPADELVRLDLGPQRDDGTHELSLVAGTSVLPFPATVREDDSMLGYCIDFELP